MARSNSAVFGIYGRCDAAENAIGVLLSKSFTVAEISVVFPGNETTRALVHRSIKAAQEGNDASGMPQGFTLVASLGDLTLPDLGQLIAAGPIMETLSSVTAGAVNRSLTAAFIEIGIPEYEARLYENALKDGGTLLSIRCDGSDRIAGAKNALEYTGAEWIASTIEAVPDDSAAGEDSGSISAHELREQRAIASPANLKFKPDPA